MKMKACRVDCLPKGSACGDLQIDKAARWGDLDSEEEESESEEEEEESDEEAAESLADGLASVASGIASGYSSLPSGIETPDVLDLRKAKVTGAHHPCVCAIVVACPTCL